MRIDDVSVTLFAWESIPVDARTPPVFFPESDLGLLTIRTDEGLIGHAFLGSSMSPGSLDAAKLVRWLKPLIMGNDPRDRERIHQAMMRLARLTTHRTVGAVDVALWDIAGQMANLPIHQLLGSVRTKLPAYASSPRLANVEDYVAQAQAVKQAGFHAYKMHPKCVPAEDIVICEAVRDAVGPDYTLMLDSSWSYDYPQAVRVGTAIQSLGYYWYEDPLSAENIYNYPKLREKLSIPIMATEYPAAGLNAYPIWLLERATDFLRGDIPNKGGITTMVKTAHLAEAFGMNFEIHHSANSLNNFANVHVAMAVANTEFFEVLLPDETQKYGLLDDVTIDSDGYVHAPMEPGLGAKIDFDLIKRRKIGTLQ